MYTSFIVTVDCLIHASFIQSRSSYSQAARAPLSLVAVNLRLLCQVRIKAACPDFFGGVWDAVMLSSTRILSYIFIPWSIDCSSLVAGICRKISKDRCKQIIQAIAFLTQIQPMFHFQTPWKPPVFWCFQEV